MNKIYLLLVCCCLNVAGYAQTGLITPTNSGGFENAPAGFASNFWTAVNGAANQWAVGTGSFSSGARGAYIGNTTTFVGTNTAAINHFYRSGSPAGSGVVIPAGATNVSLSFKYRQPLTDFGGDSLIVSVAPNTAAVPVVNTTVPPVYQRIYYNTATAYASYTTVGPIILSGYAGTAIRLAFTHVNNGTGTIAIPAVDSVALYYCDSTTGNGSICASGGVTTLTNPMTGGAWTSSNATIASVTSSTATTATITGGATSGTATITYTSGSCQVKRVITVNPQPGTITGLYSVCVGSNVTLSDAPTGGVWTSSASSIASVNSGTGIVTGNLAGTANITYTLGSCLASATISVNALPIAFNVTGGGSFCISGAGVPVGLDGSATGINYTLFNGASSVGLLPGTGSSLDFGTFTAGGTYTVLATNVSTNCSSAMNGNALLTVASPVVPSVSIAPSALLICAGNTVTFMATATNEGTTPSYEWFVNGVSMGMGGNTYTYAPLAGDIVSVVLYPGSICTSPATATDVYTVVVTPNSAPSVSIAASPGNPACVGSQVTFSAIPVNGGSSPSYRWTRNGVNVATGPAFICNPNNGDIFYCTLFSSYACRLADSVTSPALSMAMESGIAAPAVTLAAYPGNHIAVGQSDTLKAIVPGTNPVTYLWYVNSVPVAGATNSTFVSNTFSNLDIVTCKVSNTDACARHTFSSMNIYVGSLDVADINSDANSISIFPNPNNGTFTISGQLADKAEHDILIEVTNIPGQIMYSNILSGVKNDFNQQLSLSNLSKGLYILHIRSENENKFVHFIVD